MPGATAQLSMGTATAPDCDPASNDTPLPTTHSSPDDDSADMGFVNHAFHLGLPRAAGTDTWGHAALWRNPAARHATQEWDRSSSPSASSTVATLPLQNQSAARVSHQQTDLHFRGPQTVNHAPSATQNDRFLPVSHPQPVMLSTHQDVHLHAHQQQLSLAMQQVQQQQPQHHHQIHQPANQHHQRRKQWSHAPQHHNHHSQNPHLHHPRQTHVPPPRRGRHARPSHHVPQSQGSVPGGMPIRARGNGMGNNGGNGNSNGNSSGGGVPSVREFNRRISACARRRDLAGALRVLDDLDRTPGVSRNLFTYNAVINALVMCAQHAKARELWTEMQESGIEPNLVTYNTMMKSCFGGTDDDVGRAFALVKEMEQRGIGADRVTLNSLINACVTAGLLRDAQRVYEQMRARDIEPDDFTFTTLAKAGASQNNVAMLDALLMHQLHHHSTARNRAAAVGGDSGGNSKNSSTHRTSPVAYNTIADAYIRCGHPERALRLLSRLRDLHILTRNIPPGSGSDPLDGETIPVHPDVQTFNVILKALREAGAPANDAFQLIHQLKILGLEADHITLLTLADLCCRREEMALAEGVLHAATEADVREFEKGSSEWRSLCNRTTARDVQRSFQRGGANGSNLHNSHHNNAVNVPGTSSGRRNVNQPRNAKANAALFNSLIRGYSSLDPPNVDAAVALYREMQRYLELYGFTWYAADFVTYTMLVDGFARVGDATRAESIISEMESAGRANVVAYNAYMKANRASGFKAAVLVLERMKRVGLRPDVVTYNTIIDLLCSEENGAALAEELVRVDMPRNGVRPDLLTFNTLIKGAARVRGSRSDAGAALGAAYRWLRELQARGLHPDEFTYQSMVSACAAAGDAPRALEFFRKVEAERAKRSGHNSEYGSSSNSPDDRRMANPWQATVQTQRQQQNGIPQRAQQRQHNASPPNGTVSRSAQGNSVGNTNGRTGKDWMLLPHPAAYIALMRAFLTSNGKHGVNSVLLLRDEMVSRGLELGKQGHTAVADAYAERGEFEKVEETLAEMLRKERPGPDQQLGPVHHCIRMKALCNADRLDEAIAILPDVENADAAVFNVLITGCSRAKDVQRLTVVLRAMEEANVDPDAITSRAISGMMRNVAKTLRSYDEHFRDTITKFVAGNAGHQQQSVPAAQPPLGHLEKTQEEHQSAQQQPVVQHQHQGPTPGSTVNRAEVDVSSARASAADVPIDSLLNNISLGADDDARAQPNSQGLFL